jgi:hypothetical protein
VAHSRLEHRSPAARVHRDELRSQRRNPRRGASDGLRNVVKLEIQHHAAPATDEVADDHRALGAEQLESELVPVRDPGEPTDEEISLGAARRIDRRDQPVSGVEHAPVIPRRALTGDRESRRHDRRIDAGIGGRPAREIARYFATRIA